MGLEWKQAAISSLSLTFNLCGVRRKPTQPNIGVMAKYLAYKWDKLKFSFSVFQHGKMGHADIFFTEKLTPVQSFLLQQKQTTVLEN